MVAKANLNNCQLVIYLVINVVKQFISMLINPNIVEQNSIGRRTKVNSKDQSCWV